MQKVLFVFLILCTYSISAQIQSGEIIYKVKAPESMIQYMDTTQTKADPMVNKFFERRYNQIVKSTPHLHFKLKFNKDRSLFTSIKGMENDAGIDLEQMIRAVGVYGDYFTDKNQDLKIEEVFSPIDNKTILLKSSFNDLDWKIENITKTIAGFKCTKASAVVYKDSSSQKEIKVIAWFAPELPFQFGPMEYSGLPGLILGLESRNNFYFYADEIKLDKTDKKINALSKGKVIDKETYNKQMEKMSKEMIRRYEENKK